MASNKPLLAAAFVAGALALLLFLLLVVQPAASQLTHGFSSYYTASRLIREGQNVADFYDDQWFRSQTVRLGFAGAEDIYNLNPPSTALLFWPLTAVSPGKAKVVWTAVNLLLLGLVLGMVTWSFRGGLIGVAIGVALIAFFQPVREDLRLGQVYVLLLALETAMLWAYLNRRDGVAGVSLGLVVGMKTAGVGLLLLLVAQRRWRALAWTSFTLTGIVVGSLLLLGAGPWLRYFALLSRFDAHPEFAATAYQSLPGLALHLFNPDNTWNPVPLLAMPALATCLPVLSSLTLIGFTCQRTWPSSSQPYRDPALAFTAWAALDVALTPVSEDYHYTLLLLPIAILLSTWRDARRGRRWPILLVIGICLIGAPLPYKASPMAVGALAVLAYPKLYGALLLWGLATWAPRDPRRQSREGTRFSREAVAASKVA